MTIVALLTERRYQRATAPPGDWYLGNVLEEDRLLSTALAEHGIASERVDWSRTDVDWSRFDAAVFRSTWDYFERKEEFFPWLERVAAHTRLLNPPDLVRWNLDKHYLADLERAGVAVVPTRFLERHTSTTLSDVLHDTGWPEVVLKPAVSAAAFETHRFVAGEAEAHEPRLRTLLCEGAMMLQPFEPNIVEVGEVAVMVFAGQVTHAVRKRARPGDFRVQDDYGGTVHSHDATADEVALAEAAMAACSSQPLYGRVDMVRTNHGAVRVMELELVEPELWLRLHPPAAARFAQVIASQL